MKDYLYIQYYSPTATRKSNRVDNRLLVLGFGRKWFGHKYFYYISV